MNTRSRQEIHDILMPAISKCVPGARLAKQGDISAQQLYHSSPVKAIREEIVQVGKKLWLREYVDGNGGNISYRVSEDYVLCTPTMCSKGDLTTECLSLVDFENRKLFGEHPQTSEILLHLEIYKAVPGARAVIHCHPPHATAYSITRVVPQGEIIPEQEVFVGPVAIAPYDTPGTKSFAQTILPYAQDHNTILLENHGIVCWADTVTHAEWCVEVVDTYCRILLLASQLGAPIRQIPAEKIAPLLDIKRKLGLPDARFNNNAHGGGQSRAALQGANKPIQSTQATSGVNASSELAFAKLLDEVTDRVFRFINDRQ